MSLITRSVRHLQHTLHNVIRVLVLARLFRIKHGQITLIDGNHRITLGDPAHDLSVTVRVHNRRFYSRLLFGGEIGVSQSFLMGDWSCEQMTDLIRILIRNLSLADDCQRGFARLHHMFDRLRHGLRRNSQNGSLRNISQHYDIGNDFFSQFLDSTWSYSCGIFPSEESTLEEASIEKMDRICQKLELNPSDHLLEIGGGWGGLAVYAATHFGCRVTSTTLSSEQYMVACKRVKEADLESRVTILQKDYRNLHGNFDKIVSIEMIEAVGHQFYTTFFQKCSELVKPEGLMLLQGIVIKDQRFQQHITTVDFIRHFIFPGGCVPSVTALMQAMTQGSDMRLIDLEDITRHYVSTLQRWKLNFLSNIRIIQSLGYSERFTRMWELYFDYCEAGFAERQINTIHMVFAKPAFQDEIGRNPVASCAGSRSNHYHWQSAHEEITP